MKLKIFSLSFFICFLFGSCAFNSDLRSNYFDINETKWQLSYHNKSFGDRSYEIYFALNGKLLNTHPNESTKENDLWTQKKNCVTMNFNNGYAIYKGKIINSKTIKGVAKSKSGGRWKWKATKIE